MSRYYKFLIEGGVSPFAAAQWSLPSQNEDGTWEPGEWMPALDGEVVRCERGYHFCTAGHLLSWLNAELYELETDDGAEVVVWGDKCATTARCRLTRRVEAWNERSARHFACDCAERVLPVFEREQPGDERPRQAIAVARRFADGEATREELDAAWAAARAAARDAAMDATWAASWDGAGAAARAAARAVARDAVWSAAWSAAWSASRAAAWDAERQWQIAHLCEMLGIEP